MDTYEVISIPAGYTQITTTNLSTNNGTTESLIVKDQLDRDSIKSELVWQADKVVLNKYLMEGVWTLFNSVDLVIGDGYKEEYGVHAYYFGEYQAYFVTADLLAAKTGTTEELTDSNGTKSSLTFMDECVCISYFEPDGVGIKATTKVLDGSYILVESGQYRHSPTSVDPLDEGQFKNVYQLKA